MRHASLTPPRQEPRQQGRRTQPPPAGALRTSNVNRRAQTCLDGPIASAVRLQEQLRAELMHVCRAPLLPDLRSDGQRLRYLLQAFVMAPFQQSGLRQQAVPARQVGAGAQPVPDGETFFQPPDPSTTSPVRASAQPRNMSAVARGCGSLCSSHSTSSSLAVAATDVAARDLTFPDEPERVRQRRRVPEAPRELHGLALTPHRSLRWPRSHSKGAPSASAHTAGSCA